MTRSALVLALALSFVSSCGSSSTPPAEYPPMPDEEDAGASMVTLAGSPLEELNRRARAGAVTETIHGVSVEDPYRALEEDSALTHEWIDVQTARTASAVMAWSRAETSRSLSSLLRIGTVGGAVVAGDSVFYQLREGEREQPALMVRAVGRGASDEARVLVDPLTYGEHAALDWYFVSPTGRYVAFGISQNGDERSTLRVLETTSGTLLPDTIEHAKWSEVTWLHDETGFYYRRYPREGEPDYDASQPDSYHTRLFFHALRGDAAADVLVFSPTDGTHFPSASVSDDDRWLVVSNFAGWSQSDVMLFDRGARARGRLSAPDATHPLVPVVVGQDHLYTARVHHGQLYVLTNEDAPRYRLMRVAPGAAAADRSTWQVVIPEGTAAIQDWTIAGDRHVLHVLDDVHSRLFVHRLDGALDHEMALPGPGAVAGIDGDPETGRMAVGFSGYVYAPQLLLWDPRAPRPRRSAHPAASSEPARELRTLVEIPSPVDLSTLEVVQEHVPSTDGASIPLYYIQRRGTPHDGSAPVLLNAYGGFNISLLPNFTRHPLYWVERGGIFAVANLRGGGEFGEDWHRAGNLANKHHVFEDMEAVIRWFSTSGISRPERIGITGGSNGGLLMGAMITRCPDAFGAAASYVGLYDMVRYHQFPPAELWVTEYGSSESEEQFHWLYDYSPYHHVTTGTHYPAILIETADHDTRVFWGHSTKFAARLEEAVGGADPSVWFYREQQVGHGAGTPVSALVARYTRMYAFLEHALGVSDPIAPAP